MRPGKHGAGRQPIGCVLFEGTFFGAGGLKRKATVHGVCLLNPNPRNLVAPDL